MLIVCLAAGIALVHSRKKRSDQAQEESQVQKLQKTAVSMRMDLLEEVLSTTENVKFIYVIPTFQNPSGRTMTLERRKQLLALAKKYDVPK